MSKAIYRMVENGAERFYKTDFAGGFSYPFEIFSRAKELANRMSAFNLSGKICVSDVAATLRVENDSEYNGKWLLDPISDSEAVDKINEFQTGDTLPFFITLNFNYDEITFSCNKNLPQPMDDCTVKVSEFSAPNEVGSPREKQEIRFKEALERYTDEFITKKKKPVQAVICTGSEDVPVRLPLAAQEMEKLHEVIRASNIEGMSAEITDVDNFDYEAFMDIHNANLGELNILITWAEEAEQEDLDTLLGVIEADDLSDIKRILLVADNICEYTRVPADNDEEYGHYVLYEANDEHIDRDFSSLVEDYIDFDRFGYDYADENNVERTSHGYISRSYKAEQLEKQFDEQKNDIKM